MTTWVKWRHEDRRQVEVYAGIAAVVVAVTILGMPSNIESFHRFIGEVNPLAAILGSVLVGGISLVFLSAKGWFRVFRDRVASGLLRAILAATVLASFTVLADLNGAFPADLNVAFPQSLTFYPAIAFFVEVLFHVLPLALLALIATLIAGPADSRALVWGCVLAVSLLEPAYQILSFARSADYAAWAPLYLALHLTLFNIVQLGFFRRYGFISLYTVRIAYYAIWHIGWEYIRLMVLF